MKNELDREICGVLINQLFWHMRGVHLPVRLRQRVPLRRGRLITNNDNYRVRPCSRRRT